MYKEAVTYFVISLVQLDHLAFREHGNRFAVHQLRRLSDPSPPPPERFSEPFDQNSFQEVSGRFAILACLAEVDIGNKTMCD